VTGPDAPRCRALLRVSGDERRFLDVAAELARLAPGALTISASDGALLEVFDPNLASLAVHPSAHAAANELLALGAPVLVVTDVVGLPDDVVDRALGFLVDDLRNATVSFSSNDAGPLSFPTNHPTAVPPPGFDYRTLTARLRACAPALGAVPAPYAAGAAVVISPVAFGAVGPLEGPAGAAFETALADFSLRGRERGFVDLVDFDTFVVRVPTPGVHARRGTLPEDGREWVTRRHPQLIAAIEAEAASGVETPLAIATRVARTKVFGIRVLVDDATLGPFETGAQITTLAIIDALAKHPEVAEVGVALAGHIPHYARAVLGQPKINVSLRVGANYGHLADFDVLHRTAQPDKEFDVDAGRAVAKRVVVSILDLIAYRAGSYHATSDDWLQYRAVLREAARRTDGITTISEDVAQVVFTERLAVEPERVFPVLYGTEHLSGNEDAEFPAELAANPGTVAGEFLFCLGTDYAHKNRDLAIGTLQELRARGRDLTLVLAGPSVPYGGSRGAERQRLAAAGDDGVVFLPNLSSRERNWLFRHAAAVLYPTSAEGFGLVPFEAARFGAPTVTVGFGPLLETSAGVPVVASSWSTVDMADCVERLLDDPILRRSQVSTTLAAADRYNWHATVDGFVTMYRALLARPAR
jgi:glycosyltransferase involved in cell wall biosynthesis